MSSSMMLQCLQRLRQESDEFKASVHRKDSPQKCLRLSTLACTSENCFVNSSPSPHYDFIYRLLNYIYQLVVDSTYFV